MKYFLFIFAIRFAFTLDYLIPPEVHDDSFYYKINEIAKDPSIKNILEIGSSSGEGSTAAFIKGIRKNKNKPTLFCMEISLTRYLKLKEYYQHLDFVKCYNVSSVPESDYASKREVYHFIKKNDTVLKNFLIKDVISWLERDIQYLKESRVEQNGIDLIKKENKIEYFDIVLLDGCEFTGQAELKKIYGAKYIFLDDIMAFKNWHNYRGLLNDKNYELVDEDKGLRHGWALFKKI